MALISFEIKRCKTFALVIFYKLLEKKEPNSSTCKALPIEAISQFCFETFLLQKILNTDRNIFVIEDNFENICFNFFRPNAGNFLRAKSKLVPRIFLVRIHTHLVLFT